MDFRLSDEHRMVQQMVREFAEREIRPVIKEHDRAQKPIPWLFERMAALGLMGICIPVKYGGAGMDYISLGLACEELERVDSSLRVVMSVHVALNSLSLLQWGTEEQKQRYLVPQAKGEKIAAYALTEPGAGSDAAAIRATARRQGDVYILNGEKTWISLADLADHFLVIAKTDPEKGHRGMSAFIVERSFPGVKTGTLHGKLGVRAGNTGWIVLEDTPVPAENRLGEEGEGFYIAMAALDNGRYTVAAGAAGLIRACLEASVKYANERMTFGRRIGEHQLVQEMIAKMAANYEIARLLYLRAGWMKNMGLRNTRETSLAKWFATEAAVQAALDAIQIHGAYGYSDEYDVERYLRNAKGEVIYEGTSQIHTILQAEYALGYRRDRPLRCELPAYDPEIWRAEPAMA
ncbi:acyl-CoA dehydrogenase family protein [Thermoflexus sp.]|uniref:acyl-CoA dehydrogenase family protein n=1 Tax=Thermoflexus sp. TaxID=1969742 RepID=UPI0025F79DD2|nr:acyl-CoA dehydrogenase family protein [Thermoflexus sp.]MDW8065345.1 acyl-CoA dehydrogenase family protein [Anaerolineae bacterium]MCS6962824.1 acyl-CoA dehydrogenase family protein [Thermoflexus sp.]MCS7350554.1 acyl-CoA dehydrogenase family protein [Thermoflexus sp.]MCX7690727.1 acyl-CoA dehydrogenase family protein [Thermoflexus sp.]MDW8180005.1 acyl-CoA dehydrogenase family protein [Anaerolineae bacterium]